MIKELEQELIAKVKEVPAFKGSYSIFDLDDLEAQANAGINYPVVGVGYNGCAPVAGNAGVGQATGVNTAGIVDGEFIIVIGLQYGETGQSDTKQSAFDLLDQVRAVVLGFKGVNSRPWRFISEGPQPDASGDGKVFYAQVWRTAFASQGSSINQ